MKLNERQKNCQQKFKPWKQGTEGNVMNKFLEYDDFEPRSEADAQAEWDEWMKQAIMDDKAQ